MPRLVPPPALLALALLALSCRDAADPLHVSPLAPALDITTGIVVLEALDRVNRELGTATVVITHNAAIAGMADRVVRLSDGRIVAVETNERKLQPQELSW